MSQINRLSGLPGDYNYHDQVGAFSLSNLFSRENITKAFNTAQTVSTVGKSILQPTTQNTGINPTAGIQKQGTTSDGVTVALTNQPTGGGFVVLVNGQPNGELVDFSIQGGVLTGYNSAGNWYRLQGTAWTHIPAPTTQVTVSSFAETAGAGITAPSGNTGLLIGAGVLAALLIFKKKKKKD